MPAELLSVEQALAEILPRFHLLPSETIPLEHARSRILATDIRADVNIPAFANSSMDGYAILASDSEGASHETPRELRVVGNIPAGAAPDAVILHPGEAARIMTGAPIPTDDRPGSPVAVVPVEATDAEWRGAENASEPEIIRIFKSVRAGDYVRPVGEDIQAGATVLREGTTIRAQEMGVLAALGIANIDVIQQPRVAILSSGDELLEIDQPLEPGKIRNSNAYTLIGLVESFGGIPIRIPTARDTREDTERAFREALTLSPHLLLSTAGVSVGVYDYVREVMETMGSVSLWRVNLRPGKPLAFGQVGGIPIFGLPGNPVSAMVTFDVFVRPALAALSGQPDAFPTITATIGERIVSDGRRSYIRVKIMREGERWIASSTGTQSSGALMSMVIADGLLILPEGVMEALPGESYSVRVLKPLND